MKRILIVTVIAASTILSTSCNKEYNCECDNYSVIIEAANDTDAAATCANNGANCEIR